MPAVALALLAAVCVGERGVHNDDAVADEATAYAVQRLALDTLFNGREHAARIVLWTTDAGDGPALEALGPVLVRPAVPRAMDIGRLGAALPASVVSETELSALFRRNPDAWAAFFGEYPGAAGLVELSPVRLARRGTVAETYVGRSCGEHCRNVWWLRARQVTNEGWRVDTLRWVRVPDA